MQTAVSDRLRLEGGAFSSNCTDTEDEDAQLDKLVLWSVVLGEEEWLPCP